MENINKYSDQRLKNPQFIKGGQEITIFCKDGEGTNLGTVQYDCGGETTRIDKCKDTYPTTEMTTGPGC